MLPVPTNGQTAYLVSISFRKAQGDKLRTKIKANGLDGFIEAISKQSYLFRSNVLVQTTTVGGMATAEFRARPAAKRVPGHVTRRAAATTEVQQGF